MHPILFETPLLPIHTYGALIALGFLVGYFWMFYSARKVGEDPQQISEIALAILISGVIGARLLYVLVNFDRFRAEPIAVFKIWEGGLVLYGGILGAILAGAWLIRKKGMSLHRTADVVMPCVMLGLSIGRWGCLMAGCCFGRPAPGLPWAITFPPVEGSMLPEQLVGKPLHPTQIYMSLNALIIFLILTYVLKRRLFAGQVFYLSLILYSVTRSIIEIFRGDYEQRGYFGPLSTSQWIGLVVAAFAIWRYLALRRAALRARSSEPKDKAHR